MAIPKPGKDDYSAAKAYRVISGKMVEKVAAMLVSAHCEMSRGFHPGQYGCRPRRSAVYSVEVAIVRTRGAWKPGMYHRSTTDGRGSRLPQRGKRVPPKGGVRQDWMRPWFAGLTVS